MTARFPIVLLAAVVLALGAGCGGGSTGGAERPAAASGTTAPDEATPFRVALDWFPNPDHVGLYYTLEHGMFEARGLLVELQTPSDPSAGLKLVATGEFDLAVFYEGDMFYAAEEGLPVVAVAALVPRPLNSVIALAGSSVDGPEAIEGATVGIAGLPFDEAVLATLRREQGLAESDVETVNVGFNLVPALLTGKVDAIVGAYWNIEAPQIALETGEEPTVIQLEEIGVPPYDELVLVANADRLAAEPAYADEVRRFLAGVVEGTEGAIADEQGSVRIMEEQTEYEPEEIAAMVPPTLGVLRPAGGRQLGCLDLEGWDAFGRWMIETGLLSEPVQAAAIATNDYSPGC